MPTQELAPPTPSTPRLLETGRVQHDSEHTLCFDIDTGLPHKAGDIVLRFAPRIGDVTVDSVFLYNKHQKQGTTTEVYRRLPELPLEDGRTLAEAGYKVVASPKQTEAGKALWGSLLRNGIAVKRDDGQLEIVHPPSE